MFKTYSEAREKIINQEVSCVDLVKHYTKQIEEKAHLNAYLEVFEESALAKAKEVDEKIVQGKAGKLAGCIIGIKDNICYKGHKVTASSKILEGFESLYSATAIERLLAEDAIIIGRLNCDEFAMGGSNENSAFGPALNPLNETLVTGGSSGGSASAVAAELCMISLGSDTGGSVRQPASFCGVAGLKPTYGRVSRYGLIAYGSSFDQIGPLAHNIEDISLVMEVIAGEDENDSTSSKNKVQEYSNIASETKKLKIAYLNEAIENEGVDSEIKTSMTSLFDNLKKEGHEVEGISFSLLDYIIPTYYVLTAAEASSNLSRYDGARYGYRSENATDIESTYVKSRSEGFGDEVKRRIMYGNFVLSSGYYDAYYTKAQKIRRIIKEKTEEILKEYDFIVLPTCPTTAFEIGGNIKDPMTMYLQDIFTVHANLSGNPAISLPLYTHSNGMPIGVQVMGKSFDEKSLLSFSNELMSINA